MAVGMVRRLVTHVTVTDRTPPNTMDTLLSPNCPRRLTAVAMRERRNPRRSKGFVWSGWPDLNRRPLVPQTSALPDCATARST